MTHIKKLGSVLVLVSASWLAAAPARAEQPSPQGPTTTMTQRISTAATVVSIDAQKRHLTLRGDDGNEFTVDVPASVKLDQIREGERLKIDYYEALGISLKKGPAGGPPRAGTTTVTERNAGTLPGGMVAHRITGTVEILRIDRTSNRLTVRRPNGTIDTIEVTDPAMQAQLANVHEGDRIQLTYTEATAIKVMPQAAPNESKQPSPSGQPNPPTI
jgi:hypothetical protein